MNQDAAPADPTPDDDEPRRRALGMDEILQLLRTGTMELHQSLDWSSNYTFVATVTQDDLTVAVVYKPKRGESPLWDFPTGTLYKREEAAFLISQALGWQLVPPTVTRRGQHGVGMVQFYIDHDPEQTFFTFREPWNEQLTRLVLFDALINNADRKGGHCLLDKNGRIWAIDHGVCFHEEYKLRTVIWELAGDPIPDELLLELAGFQGQLERGELCEKLERLLSPVEVGALRLRLADLLRRKAFPRPRPGRPHVPWPLV